jgi:hypothetical protein
MNAHSSVIRAGSLLARIDELLTDNRARLDEIVRTLKERT